MTARHNYGSMTFLARHNQQALRQRGSRAEIVVTGATFQAWLRELHALVVPDCQEIKAGDVIRLDEEDLIATGPPAFDYGTRSVGVAPVHNFASVLRFTQGPRDGIGRPQGELVAVAQEIPVVCKGLEKFYVSPQADILQGDLLEIRGERYLVLSAPLPDPQRLTSLFVQKEQWSAKDAS